MNTVRVNGAVAGCAVIQPQLSSAGSQAVWFSCCLSGVREEGNEERQLCRLVGFLVALLFLTALKAS